MKTDDEEIFFYLIVTMVAVLFAVVTGPFVDMWYFEHFVRR
jgi:hypothetical protein